MILCTHWMQSWQPSSKNLYKSHWLFRSQCPKTVNSFSANKNGFPQKGPLHMWNAILTSTLKCSEQKAGKFWLNYRNWQSFFLKNCVFSCGHRKCSSGSLGGNGKNIRKKSENFCLNVQKWWKNFWIKKKVWQTYTAL